MDKWKEDPKSPDYDYELIQARLDQLREIRSTNKGQSAMIFALRSSLARNLGDMGNPKVRFKIFHHSMEDLSFRWFSFIHMHV